MNSAGLPPPQTVAKILAKRLKSRPTLAMVLGSGFGEVTKHLERPISLPYSALPGFPRPRVPGHEGRLLCGELGGATLVLLSGRSHYYEGHSLDRVTFPIRVLAAFGIRALLLTNAAGGIHRKLSPGVFMRLTDHINAIGENPLRGVLREGSPTFVDLSQVYDAELGRFLQTAARRERIVLRSGVYLAVSGPSYETPAEIRSFARLGADAVGMSTVPEAIVARQCGLRVAGLSCITNLAAGRSRHPVSHEEVLDAGARSGANAARLLSAFAQLYAASNVTR